MDCKLPPHKDCKHRRDCRGYRPPRKGCKLPHRDCKRRRDCRDCRLPLHRDCRLLQPGGAGQRISSLHRRRPRTDCRRHKDCRDYRPLHRDYRLPRRGYRLRRTDYRLPRRGYRLPHRGYRPPHRGCRPPHRGCRLRRRGCTQLPRKDCTWHRRPRWRPALWSPCHPRQHRRPPRQAPSRRTSSSGFFVSFYLNSRE